MSSGLLARIFSSETETDVCDDEHDLEDDGELVAKDETVYFRFEDGYITYTIQDTYEYECRHCSVVQIDGENVRTYKVPAHECEEIVEE